MQLEEMVDWSSTSLQLKLIKIVARIVRLGNVGSNDSLGALHRGVGAVARAEAPPGAVLLSNTVFVVVVDYWTVGLRNRRARQRNCTRMSRHLAGA
jgi:hypothetical protein